VEVGNVFSSFFRVTSLFRDPSLYGRHVVLGIAVLLVAVFARRVNPLLAAGLIALLFAGLFFSYSQSSFAALFAVTLALAAFAGARELRLVAAVTAALVLLGGVGYLFASSDGKSAREVTSDRSRRVEATVEVIRDHPAAGVGLGAQPTESQARSEQGGSPTRFVSHTTPLTVAAELGILGPRLPCRRSGSDRARAPPRARTRPRARRGAARARRPLARLQRLLRGPDYLGRRGRRLSGILESR
jgi:O-antigen ligase